MERTMSELMSQHGPTPQMGRLRCQVERRGRHSLKGYKKRFWVVDERHQRLEMYKNDQAHMPMQVFRASDVRNVIYADDKQNRFFVMVVQTRGPRDIKFRMSSFEEREAWSRAITHIMDAYSTINKHKNVLGMVQRRARTVSESLRVDIGIDSVRLLEKVPENLLQYVAEAVDIALASVTAITRAFSGEGVDMPRHYILSVHAVAEERTAYVREGAQYKPAARVMTLDVCLLRAKSGRVSFAVTQPDEAFRMVQSSVFRNPLIEGWMEVEPNCARACADIHSYLGLPADQRSWIAFQWGEDVSNSAKVEAFLQRYVTVRFFERALESLKSAVMRVERLLSDLTALPAGKTFTGSSPAIAAREAAISSPRSARRPTITPGINLYSDTSMALGNNSIAVTSTTGGAGGGGGFHSRQPSNSAVAGNTVGGGGGGDSTMAIQLIQENVEGLCIQLERRVIERGAAPPAITVAHTRHYEQHCRPAFLLVAKCRRVRASQLTATGDELSDEIFEVSHNAVLQQQLSQLRVELNSIFQKQVRVVIMWDLLFRAAENLATPLSVEELPHLVRHVKEVCLSRLQHVAQVLRHAHSDKPGHVEDHQYLFNVFCSCVDTVLITFLPYKTSGDAAVLEPSLKAGVLTDTLYCVKDGATASLMAALGHAHRSGAAKTMRAAQAASSFRSMLLYPAEAKLGAWCENYFSDPDRAVPEQRQLHIEDEFDSDSDGGSVEALQDPDFGEAVAYERSAEIRLLTMQRVVNAIYDSQRRAPVDLKIGSDDIVRAIHAFVSAFGEGKRPSKHDVARVLIINLQRLRLMYMRAVDDEMTSLLTLAQARQLLRDFCEYETNEQYIDAALRELSMMDAASVLTREERHSGAAGGGSRDPADTAEEEAIDVDVSDDPLAESHRHPHSPHTRAAEESSASARSSGGAPQAETAQRSGRRAASSSRRRYSHSGKRASAVAAARSTDTVADASTALTLGAMPSSGAMHIRVPSAPTDAFDFASVTDIALTQLLPREARLARLAWRVGFVFGLENSGKSLIVNSMRGLACPTVATVGLSQQVVAFEEWVWALNELGGRESFRKNWRYYARRIDNVHFLVFVLDILNSQALGEARQYLKEVTQHYHDAPLLVVFNNYREGHRRRDMAEFEALVDVAKLRKRHGAEVLSCLCDVTVVHSKHRRPPRALSTALRTLSSLIRSRSSAEEDSNAAAPPEPKMTTTSVSVSVLGGAVGAAAAGAVVAPSAHCSFSPLPADGGAGVGRPYPRDSITTAPSTPRPQFQPF